MNLILPLKLNWRRGATACSCAVLVLVSTAICADNISTSWSGVSAMAEASIASIFGYEEPAGGSAGAEAVSDKAQSNPAKNAGSANTQRHSGFASVTQRSMDGMSVKPEPALPTKSPLHGIGFSSQPVAAGAAVSSAFDSQPTASGAILMARGDSSAGRHPSVSGNDSSPVPNGVIATSEGSAQLMASDSVAGDQFGDYNAVSLSGNSALIGARFDDIGANNNQGSAYLFRSLNTASGTVTQTAKLTASDGAFDDRFGSSTAISGNNAVVGAPRDNVTFADQGSAYLFRNLNTASGNITENAKLIASDAAAASAFFGQAVDLSGDTALVGAQGDQSNRGAAYVFRNLGTASGTITQNAKLVASDGVAGDFFGEYVSLSGNSALIGARADDANRGSAYLFRNLDTASGTVTQTAKLTASDGVGGDVFGATVSLSGNNGLIGAYADVIGANMGQGSAYLFRNLDTASGAVTQTAKLTASDGAANDQFGYEVAISGNTGLVTATDDDIGANTNQGSAYLFLNLDTAPAAVTETVKITASGGLAGDLFGFEVAIDGDRFVISNDKEKAFTGTVSSMTTLDAGNASRTIDFLSFTSRTDWVIGQTTDANQVTLTAGDSANVTSAGKAVYIGKLAGSDNNTLVIEGSLTANQINIGAAGNSGNKLLLAGTGDRISDTAAMVMNGGTFDTAGTSETVGALTLASTSIIDLGDAASVLHFANSSGNTWTGTLNVYDWTGTFGMGGGTDQLYFGTTSSGLMMSQANQIAFYSGDGVGFLGMGMILSTGEVVPVPEPATIVAAFLTAVVLVCRSRQLRRTSLPSKAR